MAYGKNRRYHKMNEINATPEQMLKKSFKFDLKAMKKRIQTKEHQE